MKRYYVYVCLQVRAKNPNRFEERIKKLKSTVLQLSQGNERFQGLKGKLLKRH